MDQEGSNCFALCYASPTSFDRNTLKSALADPAGAGFISGRRPRLYPEKVRIRYRGLETIKNTYSHNGVRNLQYF
jgi:hypothetical protein